MRIALIIEHLDPARGGRETSTAQIAAELLRRGLSVTVLCQSCPAVPRGVSVRLLPGRGLTRADRLRHFVDQVQRVLAEESYDISHAMLPVPGATVYQPRGGTRPGLREARRRRSTPPAFALARLGEALDAHRRLLASLERKVFSDSRTLLLPNSEMVAEEIRRYFGRSEGVIVVPNGVDVPDVSPEQRENWRRLRRAELGLGDSETLFLTAATHYRLKGVDWAVRAFARAFPAGSPRRGRLVCLGQANASALRRLAARLGAARQITFLPHSPEIFSWYSAADVCVLLSWYDAASRVVLEATRWGLPAVTTTYNGAAEALAGGAGIVVERPDATEEVAAALQTLGDPAVRAAYRRAALAVSDRLTLSHHVDGLLRAYQAAR